MTFCVSAKKKVKKLLIPLLIVLKLFKLKLLLFLPLILGLASFKKVLGFLALVVPGLIGFFKLCKPDLQHNYGTFGHSSYYHRPSNAGGPPLQGGPVYSPYREHQEPQYHREHPEPQYYREHPVDPQQYLYESADAQPYNSRPARNQQDIKTPSSGSVAFKDVANDMAYNRQQRRWYTIRPSWRCKFVLYIDRSIPAKHHLSHLFAVLPISLSVPTCACT